MFWNKVIDEGVNLVKFMTEENSIFNMKKFLIAEKTINRN